MTLSLAPLLQNIPLNADEAEYLEFHRDRMVYNLEFIGTQIQSGKPLRVLEFGPHLLTRLLDAQYGDQLQIQTLGYRYERMMTPSMLATHVDFDFNDLQFPEKWPQIGPFDLIVFCEVIEHLYTAPSIVLKYLHSILAPGGKVMCSTPNAVSFSKRTQMFLGRNPFEKIRERRELMGHVREYTATELKNYFVQAGFRMERFEINNYWPQNPLLRNIGRLHPALGQGFTLLATKPA